MDHVPIGRIMGNFWSASFRGNNIEHIIQPKQSRMIGMDFKALCGKEGTVVVSFGSEPKKECEICRRVQIMKELAE